MLMFELSKMIDYIYNYGKCIVSIKLDNGNFHEIEIEATENGLNLDNDSLLQIMSLLYSEAFLPKKYDDYKNYFINLKQSNNSIDLVFTFLVPFLVNGKIDPTIKIEPPEVSTAKLNKNVNATLSICSLMESMLVNSRPLTDDLDISSYNIYDSTKKSKDSKEHIFTDLDNIAEFFDKSLIPMSIIEVLKLRKALLESKKIGEDTRKSISILSELCVLVDNKSINENNIKEILVKYEYSTITEEIRSKIDEFLTELGYDPKVFFGGLSK